MKIYMIYDTRNEEYVCYGAKVAWKRRGNAKLAVLYRHGNFRIDALKAHFNKKELSAEWHKRTKGLTYVSVKFTDQTRYECREFDMGLDLDSVIV